MGQRLAQMRFREELAARPRVSFGVRQRQEPAKIVIPQPNRHDAVERNEAGPQAQVSGDATNTPSRVRGEVGTADVLPVSAEWYGVQIRAVYERHNPTKLAQVPTLLEKYAGCEAEMYERICEKYGVPPEVPPNFFSDPDVDTRRASQPLGFARKASAPAPPAQANLAPCHSLQAPAPPPPPPQKEAPSVSSLQARFENLIADGDDFDSDDNGNKAGIVAEPGHTWTRKATWDKNQHGNSCSGYDRSRSSARYPGGGRDHQIRRGEHVDGRRSCARPSNSDADRGERRNVDAQQDLAIPIGARHSVGPSQSRAGQASCHQKGGRRDYSHDYGGYSGGHQDVAGRVGHQNAGYRGGYNYNGRGRSRSRCNNRSHSHARRDVRYDGPPASYPTRPKSEGPRPPPRSDSYMRAH